MTPRTVIPIVLVVIAAVIYFATRSPAQLGPSEAVFKTVDALYTAVRSEDMVQLSECERRLHEHRDTGALPDDAARTLEGIINQAKTGQWRPAAESLHAFMSGQRREAGVEPGSTKPLARNK